VERILAACTRLAVYPLSGRARPDLGRRVRSYQVGTYTIFYRPMRYGIEVSRLLHQRMDVESEFARRRKPSSKPVQRQG
jgi:plasmid stabilization system protein ParE